MGFLAPAASLTMKHEAVVTQSITATWSFILLVGRDLFPTGSPVALLKIFRDRDDFFPQLKLALKPAMAGRNMYVTHNENPSIHSFPVMLITELTRCHLLRRDLGHNQIQRVFRGVFQFVP